jgi:flagellar biosynthesis protein
MSETPPLQPNINPKAKAVALSFDPSKDNTPRVTASGKGALADHILRLAFENGVKVRQDQTLTEMLSLVDIESEIPVEAIVAVAEILSYVYRENGKIKDVRDARKSRLGDQ